MGGKTSKELFDEQVRGLQRIERRLNTEARQASQTADRIDAEARVLRDNSERRQQPLVEYRVRLRDLYVRAGHERARANKYSTMAQLIADEVTNLKIVSSHLTAQEARVKTMAIFNRVQQAMPVAVLQRILMGYESNMEKSLMMQELMRDATETATSRIVDTDGANDELDETDRERISREADKKLAQLGDKEALATLEQLDDQLATLPVTPGQRRAVSVSDRRGGGGGGGGGETRDD